MMINSLLHPGIAFNDYENYINSLRQLQKRVSIILIYDEKKKHLKPKKDKKTKPKEMKKDEISNDS